MKRTTKFRPLESQTSRQYGLVRAIEYYRFASNVKVMDGIGTMTTFFFLAARAGFAAFFVLACTSSRVKIFSTMRSNVLINQAYLTLPNSPARRLETRYY